MKEEYSIWSQIEELRKVLIKLIIFFSICFIALWIFRGDLLNIYLFPLEKLLTGNRGDLVLLKIVDKFFIHLKSTLFFSLIVTSPYLFYQVWSFVSPALYRSEKGAFRTLFLGSLLLFYIGLGVGYFMVIPFGFNFLIEYSSGDQAVLTNLALKSSLTISLLDQVAFTQKFLLIFGTIFQLPLLMTILAKLKIISIDKFSHYRRHAYIICMALSAILTPPDPLTMIGLSLPLIVLYEVGIVVSRIYSR